MARSRVRRRRSPSDAARVVAYAAHAVGRRRPRYPTRQLRAERGKPKTPFPPSPPGAVPSPHRRHLSPYDRAPLLSARRAKHQQEAIFIISNMHLLECYLGEGIFIRETLVNRVVKHTDSILKENEKEKS